MSSNMVYQNTSWYFNEISSPKLQEITLLLDSWRILRGDEAEINVDEV